MDSYEKIVYLFNEVSRYISNLSINDRERAEARAESLKETEGVGFDLNSLDEFESRMTNIFQTIPQESMNSLKFDKMEEETRRIGEKWQEVFEKTEANPNPNLKLKIDSDALKEDISNLKRQISILEILENSLTEEQKILLEESKDLLQKAENVKSKKSSNSSSGDSNSDYLASQYITEVSNSLANVLHGFARSTKSGIYSGTSGEAQLTSSILKTTKIDPTTATGTLHLFLEDYRDYILRRIEKWEAMLFEKETGEVVLSGYLYLDNSSTPIQTAKKGVNLRPVSFTIHSALKRMDFDSLNIFNPFTEYTQEVYLWNSDYPDSSIIHLLNEHYSLGFGIDYLTLPLSTKSFVIDAEQNVLETLSLLFYEFGYYLYIHTIGILSCEKIKLETPSEDLENLEKIKCFTIPDYTPIERQMKNIKVQYALTKVKSAEALKTEQKSVWSGRSTYSLDSEGNSQVTPFASMAPQIVFPYFSDMDKTYESIDPSFLDVNFKINIVKFDYWIGSKYTENKDISIIAVFDYEFTYKASPMIPNPDNPFPSDTSLEYFEPRLKDFTYSIKNNLPEDFKITLEDDGIRNIDSIDVYANVIFRFYKKYIELKDPSSETKSQEITLMYINEKNYADEFFQRINRHYNYGVALFSIKSMNFYPLNEPLLFDDGMGMQMVVVALSRTHSAEGGEYTYSLLNTYEPVIYEDEEWGNGVESPTVTTQVIVRNVFSSSGKGYNCNYNNDTSTIISADQVGYEVTNVTYFDTGTYFLKEKLNFSSSWRPYVQEVTVGTPEEAKVRVETRPTAEVSWRVAPSEKIERDLNWGVLMSPKKDSKVLYPKKNSPYSQYLY